MPMVMPALAPGLRPDAADVELTQPWPEEAVGVLDDAAVDEAEPGSEEALGVIDAVAFE